MTTQDEVANLLRQYTDFIEPGSNLRLRECRVCGCIIGETGHDEYCNSDYIRLLRAGLRALAAEQPVVGP